MVHRLDSERCALPLHAMLTPHCMTVTTPRTPACLRHRRMCGQELQKRFRAVYLLHQPWRAPSRSRTYVGEAEISPHVRLEQHNGVRPGGVARLACGRPWAIACFVWGFVSRCDALHFEDAWQAGLRSWELRHATFVPSHGVAGKVQLLHALLSTPILRWNREHPPSSRPLASRRWTPPPLGSLLWPPNPPPLSLRQTDSPKSIDLG